MELQRMQEREEYIGRLEKQIQVIEHILKMDAGTVISPEIKKQIRQLKTEAAAVLKKLKDDEFEIAIVGLEKAGKSTFANALMENTLLPTRDTRCTFTSTRIEYSGDGQDDNATVSFYTEEEFNRDFKDKLHKLGFPNYERYSFDTLEESVYMGIYEEKVSDDKKKAYGDSVHEDVCDIIRNAQSISGLLGCPEQTFSADRIGSGELSAYITDGDKARAVKQVVIRSKELHEMKNAVIFDVPGFNSPTELHKIQTRERMKSADAIIVVANGMAPSLTGDSLKILRESDDEGNPLSDKLFVFANKTEGSRDIAENRKETYREWREKGFVPETKQHRIVFGSALAHLQRMGLDPDNRVLRNFEEREGEMPQGDGIEAIRLELTKYNHTERFEVLKRRINRMKAEVEKIFGDIQKDHKSIAAGRNYGMDHVKLVTGLIDDVRPAAEKNLLDLRAEIRTDMPREQPLSRQIIEYISDNITVERYGISDEEIEDARKRSPYTGTHEDVGRMEADIRKAKFKEMYDDFSGKVIKIADRNHTECSERIVACILRAMEVDDDSPYREELEKILRKALSAYRGDLPECGHGSELYFQSLIERFSRDIYQVLITSQYSTERLREFYDNIDNFYSLSVFYKTQEHSDDMSYIGIAPKDQPLCRLLLFHDCFKPTEALNQLFEAICKIAGIGAVSDDLRACVEQVFAATGGHMEKITDVVKKAISGLGDKTEDFRMNLLKNKLGELIENNEACNVDQREAFTRYYESYHNSLRGGRLYSSEDFRKDFNVDIEILQDVLMNAFVRAVNMEKPFVARETKSIDDIIDYIKGKDFGEFLSDNFWKIKYTEAARLDRRQRENEQNAAIIGEINDILEGMSN